MKMLVGDHVMSLPESNIVKDKIIRSILPYRGGLIIVTSVGLYFFDGNRVKQMITGQEDFMAKYEIFSSAIRGDDIALGTIRNGVIIINLRTLSAKTFNDKNGMQDNTVLSIKFDMFGNLWAGLTEGIDAIMLKSAFTKLNATDSSIGCGYAVAQNGNTLYLGTNRGLYTVGFSPATGMAVGPFTPIAGLGGQVWGLQRIGSDLFCLHDKGLFLIQGTTATRISNVIGFWKCQFVDGCKDKMYAATYNGIYIYKKTNGKWQLLNKVVGIKKSCRSVGQENARTLWICDETSLTRLKLNAALNKVVSKKEYNDDSRMGSAKICKIEGRIFFVNKHGTFVYNAGKDKIEPYTNGGIVDGSLNYLCIRQMGQVITALGPHGIYINNLTTRHRRYLFNDIPNMEFEEGGEDVFPVGNSFLIVPNSKGFSIVNTNKRQICVPVKDMLKIREVYCASPYDSLVYTENFLGRKDEPVFKYRNNSVRIDYGLSYAQSAGTVLYQYKLNNGDWSDSTQLTSKEYSELHEGTYTFYVRAKSADGNVYQDSFTFRILPPWHRTGWAYLAYLAILVAAVTFLLRQRNKRTERKNKEMLADKDHEIGKKQAEDEKEQKEKKTDRLNQLMADMMINVTRKNDMLNDIKSELSKTSVMLSDGKLKEVRQELTSLRTRIDDNFYGDTVLNHVEEQLDMANNGFMKRLCELYPDLNRNERMMCVYLHSNLSSKEIAPLLNISVRGVETIRYRLRKKFNLGREDSLTEFLMKI
jgi:DNA-binding CsgD family transcriptional regulator